MTPESNPEQRPIERPAEQPENVPIERRPEQRPEAPVQPEERIPAAQPPVVIPSIPSAPAIKSPVVKEIETILAEDLDEVYRSMDPVTKEKFRVEGERVASKLSQLMTQVKIKTKAMLSLIRTWLRIIPGVNRYFLEQEAKIKTDRIIALAKKKGTDQLLSLLQLGLPAGRPGDET